MNEKCEICYKNETVEKNTIIWKIIPILDILTKQWYTTININICNNCKNKIKDIKDFPGTDECEVLENIRNFIKMD